MSRLTCFVVIVLIMSVNLGCRGTEVAPVSKEELAVSEVSVFESFDDESTPLGWSVEGGWGDPGEVSRVKVPGKAGHCAMAVDFKVGKNRKVVVGRKLTLGRNLSRCSMVLVDVNSKLTKKCRLGLAVLPAGGWEGYAESLSVEVKPGLNTDVTFRLNTPTFKTKANGWKHAQLLGDLAGAQRLMLLVYADGAGCVEFDNIRTIRAGAPRPVKKGGE